MRMADPDAAVRAGRPPTGLIAECFPAIIEAFFE
jgi:hypothetical protein